MKLSKTNETFKKLNQSSEKSFNWKEKHSFSG
jgi:hypothetical protein